MCGRPGVGLAGITLPPVILKIPINLVTNKKQI